MLKNLGNWEHWSIAFNSHIKRCSITKAFTLFQNKCTRLADNTNDLVTEKRDVQYPTDCLLLCSPPSTKYFT